jgi:putative glycosyltransferase
MISIVTTLYRSSSFISEFYTQCILALNEIGLQEYEFIFVLDGITDNAKSELLLIKEKDQKISIIELSRNFGHHQAALAGLNQAKGDLIFLIDCDLEVSPRELSRFFSEMTDEIDVVYGYQVQRKGGVVERISGKYFWKMFNALSDYKIPENMVTERLMRRDYLNQLLALNDKNLFLAGMMHWVGYNQLGIPVNKAQRKGKSTYNLTRKITLFIEAITSFSDRPIWLIFYFGVIITILGVIGSCYFVFRRLMFPEIVLAGYTSLIVAMMLGTGLISLFLGFTGLYISRIFKQTRERPNYIIKKIE